MCNCNQKRSMYFDSTNKAPQGMVKVKLIKDNPIVLNGDITGRTYIFRALNDINWVDKRDALSLKEEHGLLLI